MKKVFIALLVAAVLVAVVLTAKNMLMSSAIEKQIDSFVRSSEWVEDWKSGKVNYDENNAYFNMEGFELTLNDGTLVTADRMIIERLDMENRRAEKFYLDNVTFQIEGYYKGSCFADWLLIDNPDVSMTGEMMENYLNNSMNPLGFMSFPLSLENIRVEGIECDFGDSFGMSISSFDFTGPAEVGRVPAEVHSILRDIDIETNQMNVHIPEFSQKRIYDRENKRYTEVVSPVVVENFVTFEMAYTLGDFEESYIGGLYDMDSDLNISLEHAYIKIEDMGLMNYVYSMAGVLFGIGSPDEVKQMVAEQIRIGARTELSMLNNPTEVADAIVKWIESPDTLEIILAPAAPVPFYSIPDIEPEDLNITLTVNNSIPVRVR